MINTNPRIQFVCSYKRRFLYNSSFHTPVTYLNTGKYWLWQRLIFKKKKIKDPTAHDIPRYFPQLLVTLQFWLCPRNRNPQLQLLLDTWKKHMLKQLTKLWHLHFSPDCQSLRFFSMWFYRNQNNDHKSSWPHLSLPSALLWKNVKKKKSKAGENNFSID